MVAESTSPCEFAIPQLNHDETDDHDDESDDDGMVSRMFVCCKPYDCDFIFIWDEIYLPGGGGVRCYSRVLIMSNSFTLPWVP